MGVVMAYLIYLTICVALAVVLGLYAYHRYMLYLEERVADWEARSVPNESY